MQRRFRSCIEKGRMRFKKAGMQPVPFKTKINNYLEPVKSWLAENVAKSDYVLIQVDFGACYIMVHFAFEKGLIPVYSTTRREAVEEHGNDGSIKLVHQFKHQIFRKYGV